MILVIKLALKIYIKHRGQLVTQALADGYFMFLQASHDNLEKEMYVRNQKHCVLGANSLLKFIIPL